MDVKDGSFCAQTGLGSDVRRRPAARSRVALIRRTEDSIMTEAWRLLYNNKDKEGGRTTDSQEVVT